MAEEHDPFEIFRMNEAINHVHLATRTITTREAAIEFDKKVSGPLQLMRIRFGLNKVHRVDGARQDDRKKQA